MRYFGRQEYRDLNSTGVDNAGNIEISYLCYQRPPLLIYDLLHIAGYYRALIYNTQVVKDTLKAAEKFIGKLGKTLSSH